MAKYLTKQRKKLQEYLSDRVDQELSAKKLAEDLAENNISLSAIYRNLIEMEKDNEVIQYHKEGSREVFFRYIKTDDCLSCFHFSCKVCNQTEHMPIKDTHLIKESIDKQFDFTLDLPSTVFYGTCRNCKSI